MLNKQLFETESFATEAISTVTVGQELLKPAANDEVGTIRNAGAQQVRRGRRPTLFSPSNIGGWKVRMW